MDHQLYTVKHAPIKQLKLENSKIELNVIKAETEQSRGSQAPEELILHDRSRDVSSYMLGNNIIPTGV